MSLLDTGGQSFVLVLALVVLVIKVCVFRHPINNVRPRKLSNAAELQLVRN